MFLFYFIVLLIERLNRIEIAVSFCKAWIKMGNDISKSVHLGFHKSCDEREFIFDDDVDCSSFSTFKTHLLYVLFTKSLCCAFKLE